jgi:hypothetical protein
MHCLTVKPVCRGFKAYKQIVKLQLKMGAHEEMLQSYRSASGTSPAARSMTPRVPSCLAA